MKNLTLIGLIVVSTYAFGNAEKVVKSKISNVTVFLSGAQVERTSNVSLKKGLNEVVFENVSPHLDANSLQATGKGDFIILSVTKDVKYPENVVKTESESANQKKMRLLKDSLKWLNFDLEDLKFRMGFLNKEKELLQKNKIITGESKGDSLELFQQAMVYMRKQLFDINKELKKYRREEILMNEELQAMNSRLTAYQNIENNKAYVSTNNPSHRVVVSIQADKDVYGRLDVSYIVANAGWKPSYDIRADNTNSPVELTYKAEVFQNSGIDWDNVDLKLSSSSAYRTTTKPELPTWYLNYYAQPTTRYKLEGDAMTGGAVYNSATPTNGFSYDQNQELGEISLSYEKNAKSIDDAQSSAMYSQMVTGKTNVEFELELKYTIKTGEGGQLMAIQQTDLKSDYYHYLVPKVDKEAFLLARIDDWEQLNLLPASASIFFEGSFIGKSMINPDIMEDTLEIALGRDSRVICERELIKDKEKEKLIGNDKLMTYNYKIEVKNNRNNSIKNLIVEDQIPVTHIEDIKIELLKKDGAKLNERTGRLTWRASINAHQTKTYDFGYSVKHDKNKLLSKN
jgi:uncharacterized protein (TIGR02231 family)